MLWKKGLVVVTWDIVFVLMMIRRVFLVLLVAMIASKKESHQIRRLTSPLAMHTATMHLILLRVTWFYSAITHAKIGLALLLLLQTQLLLAHGNVKAVQLIVSRVDATVGAIAVHATWTTTKSTVASKLLGLNVVHRDAPTTAILIDAVLARAKLCREIICRITNAH
jgi:hypothetical protein